MAAPKFIPAATSLDPNAGLDTSNFKRQMALAALLSQGAGDKISSVPEGVGHVISKGLGGWMQGAAEADEKAAQSEANALQAKAWGAMLGGSDSIPTKDVGTPAAGGGDFMSKLIGSESGGRWDAQNNVTGAGGMPGHFGRLQFGQARLQDAMRAGAIPEGTTPQAFMASPELQKAAEAWHFADINQNIQNSGLASMVGQRIGNTPVTMDGMRAVAHLGGFGGLKKFIESGGRYNPADANGTRLSDYFARMSGNVVTPPNVGNNMAVTPSAPTAPMPNMADLTPGTGGQASYEQTLPNLTTPEQGQRAMNPQPFVPGSDAPFRQNMPSTATPDQAQRALNPQPFVPGSAAPYQENMPGTAPASSWNRLLTPPAPGGVAMTEEDVIRAEMETGMVPPPAPQNPVLSPMPTPGAPSFQPGPAVAGQQGQQGQMPSMPPLPPPRPPMADLTPQTGGQAQAPAGYTPGMLAPNQQGGNGQPYLAPFQTPQAPTPQMLAQGLVQGGPEGQMSMGQQAQAPQQDRRQLLAQILANPRVPPQVKTLMLQQFQAQTQPQPADFGVIGENADGSKQYGFIDKRTRTATPYGSPGSGQPRFRNLTDPAERAKFGIAPNDNRPYQVGADGKLLSPGGQTISVDASQKTQAKGDEESEKFIVGRIGKIVEEGDTARTDMMNVQQLRALGANIGTGGGAALRAALSSYGVKIGDDIGNIEAFRALVSKMVPQQRPPGSGAASDKDMDMFKAALPSLMNTPAGNEILFDTLEAIAADKAARAQIGERALLGEISRKDAIAEMRKLPSPFARFQEFSKAQGQGQTSAAPPPGKYRWNPQTNQMEPDR